MAKVKFMCWSCACTTTNQWSRHALASATVNPACHTKPNIDFICLTDTISYYPGPSATNVNDNPTFRVSILQEKLMMIVLGMLQEGLMFSFVNPVVNVC